MSKDGVTPVVEETNLPVVEEAAVNDVIVVEDDGISTGHKIAFYVICGVVCLTIVGIPVLGFLYLRERKKVKMLTEAQATAATETAPVVEAPAATEETKAAETQAETPEKKKK